MLLLLEAPQELTPVKGVAFTQKGAEHHFQKGAWLCTEAPLCFNELCVKAPRVWFWIFCHSKVYEPESAGCWSSCSFCS